MSHSGMNFPKGWYVEYATILRRTYILFATQFSALLISYCETTAYVKYCKLSTGVSSHIPLD